MVCMLYLYNINLGIDMNESVFGCMVTGKFEAKAKCYLNCNIFQN